MKKMLKKLLSVALVFAIVMCLVPPVEAQAAAKQVNLKNKQWYTSNETKYQTVFHKITVPKDGYITLQGYAFTSYSSNASSLYVRLCNNKKKLLTKNSKRLTSYNGYTNFFAVKRGTYYIKLDGSKYNLRYSFKAVKDQGGSSKTKAKTIGKGKTVKGLALAGEKGKKSDWYKVNIPKDQKMSIVYNVRACADLRFTVIPASSKVRLTGANVNLDQGKAIWKTKGKFPAGTYYIQVSRWGNDKDTSGYYTIKFK